jgi:hypothetical protein
MDIKFALCNYLRSVSLCLGDAYWTSFILLVYCNVGSFFSFKMSATNTLGFLLKCDWMLSGSKREVMPFVVHISFI